MEKTYKTFKKSVKGITHYYMLLVEETRSQRLVGSTNEWVLDNYYMISEQEKVLKEELKGVEKGKWRVGSKRVEVLWKLLESYLRKCHHQVDKTLFFRYLSPGAGEGQGLPQLPRGVCAAAADEGYPHQGAGGPLPQAGGREAYHYIADRQEQADLEQLDKAAQQNLQMMNIFNSLKKMTKLPMAELIDAVSFSERMLKSEKAGMYDEMQDKTKEDYRAKVVRLSRKAAKTRKRSEHGEGASTSL